jgi:hypothetical protein
MWVGALLKVVRDMQKMEFRKGYAHSSCDLMGMGFGRPTRVPALVHLQSSF